VVLKLADNFLDDVKKLINFLNNTRKKRSGQGSGKGAKMIGGFGQWFMRNARR